MFKIHQFEDSPEYAHAKLMCIDRTDHDLLIQCICYYPNSKYFTTRVFHNVHKLSLSYKLLFDREPNIGVDGVYDIVLKNCSNCDVALRELVLPDSVKFVHVRKNKLYELELPIGVEGVYADKNAILVARKWSTKMFGFC